jgi:hypothetical protein
MSEDVRELEASDWLMRSMHIAGFPPLHYARHFSRPQKKGRHRSIQRMMMICQIEVLACCAGGNAGKGTACGAALASSARCMQSGAEMHQDLEVLGKGGNKMAV